MPAEPEGAPTVDAAPGAYAGGRLRYSGAAQQPSWADPLARDEACALLADRPVLVPVGELFALRRRLARVASGTALVLQAGDCAESFAECTPRHAARKARVLHVLGDELAWAAGLPVTRVGRIGGQFAKPRSAPAETVGGMVLPTFRGHMVNGEAPDPGSRLHDPARMLRAYDLAHAVTEAVRARSVWTSHEALVLDYEAPLVRFDEDLGEWLLGSAHLPWIGERTRHSDGAHVRLLADVINPVACKISGAGPLDDLLRTCDHLDPGRTPGRLTLIARFGAGSVPELADVARAVREAGHPVTWLCDPMHGNTYRTAAGLKTRHLDAVVAEVRGFVTALRAAGVTPGGLHLETAAEDVTECVGEGVPDEDALTARNTSLCDPRLNPRQASLVVRAFAAALRRG